MRFFTNFNHEFEHLFHEAPTYVHTARIAIAFAAPFVVSLVGLYDPAAMPLLLPVLDRVKAGLAVASTLVGEGAASAPTLQSTLATLQADLPEILTIDGVKDTASNNKITTTVNLILGELQAVQSMLPTGSSNSLPVAHAA